MALLTLSSFLPIRDWPGQAIWLTIMTLVLVLVARPALDFSAPNWTPSVLIGILVFALWIAPDLLFPGYRHSGLFENRFTGSSLVSVERGSSLALALRMVRSAVIVPIAEELFWRAWLMRWIISADFVKVPLGAYTPISFWIVAILFASEHGSRWDVGLAAGVIYNLWMMRTRSLGDLILAHAVTNACLSAYVILAGKWEYWL
jgi:CAAX prenyl protease-like protein